MPLITALIRKRRTGKRAKKTLKSFSPLACSQAIPGSMRLISVTCGPQPETPVRKSCFSRVSTSGAMKKAVYSIMEGDETHEERLDGGNHGWYAQGVFKFSPRWRIGARYSLLYSPEDSGIEHDPYAVAVMGDWSNSEFSRLRLQYNYEKVEGDLSDKPNSAPVHNGYRRSRDT